MNYYSNSDELRADFEKAAARGEALLYALKETRSSNNPVPGNLRAAFISLASAYAVLDSELTEFTNEALSSTAMIVYGESIRNFKECAEIMQNLAAEMSAMYMFCVDCEDFSVMAKWQAHFCDYYPNILTATNAIINGMRKDSFGYEMSCVYASPGIIRPELRGDLDDKYPFNHVEEPDMPIMGEVYGSPEMTNRTIVLDDLPLVDVDLIETMFFCPKCGESIPMSSKRCPRCGFVLVF